MSRVLAAHHGAFGRVCLYELDQPLVPHAHREGQLIVHLSGQGALVRVAGQTVVAEAGRAVAVSPWQLHEYRLIDAADRITSLVLYIDPVWFAGESANALRFGDPSVELDDGMSEIVDKIVHLLLHRDSNVCLNELLMSLTAACFDASNARLAPHALPQPARPLDDRIRKSIELMVQRVDDNPEIDRIASDAGLSRPQFYRLFRDQLGITPNVYLNTLRAERAIDRLTKTDQAVTSIALDLGFSSQTSFARFFRANVGVSPNSYRRIALAS